jgi:hypothetical protein
MTSAPVVSRGASAILWEVTFVVKNGFHALLGDPDLGVRAKVTSLPPSESSLLDSFQHVLVSSGEQRDENVASSRVSPDHS